MWKRATGAGIVFLFASARASAMGQGTPTETLSIPAHASSATHAQMLSDDPAQWNIQQTPIHLNRTPPLFATDERDDGYRPGASVQVQKLDTLLYVRLVWTDSTIDSVSAARVYADAGEPHIYKRQSEIVSHFPDAACVMVPASSPQGGVYPGFMMGDRAAPVKLYYWRAGEGFSLLQAAGRETVAKTSETLFGQSSRLPNEWSVVFVIPALGDLTPIAFGIWDGAKGHRDGIKYFSLWYDVR